MAKSSRNYWTEREEKHRAALVRDEKKLAEAINDTYARMIREANQQIDSWYQNYAKKEGITLAEAKKRVSSLDIKEYEAKAKEYVRTHDLSDQANQEMRLYNLTMKVNRLELLKSQIGMSMAGGFSRIEEILGHGLTQEALKEMERQAGILGKTVQHNERAAKTIAEASFWNASFSDRIWHHQDMLKVELDRSLQRGLIQGKNPRALAIDIKKIFGASQKNAERLMITEMARVQTDAQKASYERNGYDEYVYVACGGADCCDACASLDGQIFPVRDMQPGVNAPPMHPYCHCSTAAHVDDEKYRKWLEETAENNRRAREEAGTEAAEKERLQKSYPNTVQTKALDAPGFIQKFIGITGKEDVDRAIYNSAVEILDHRKGSNFEDLHLIDADTGEVIHRLTTCNIPHGVDYDVPTIEAIAKAHREGRRIISVHNHPGGLPPTLDDGVSAYDNKYMRGVAVGHNLEVYDYSQADDHYTRTQCKDLHKEIVKAVGFSIDYEEAIWYDLLKIYGMEVIRR